MHTVLVTPFDFLSIFWRNRYLIKASIIRDIQNRYRGSFFGIFWSFLNPLLMLSVYTFVFSVIFQSRWGGVSSSKTEFAIVLFAGLMMFNFFAECINKSPNLIVSNINYVKKVVFPLEILPVVCVFSALFQLFVNFIVWLLAYVIFYGLPNLSILLFPLIVIPFTFFIIGLGWFLASLGVYIRDISQIIGAITSTLIFLSPIFYPVSALPDTYQVLLYLNPLTPVIEMTRDVLFWGKVPDLNLLALYWLVTFGIALIGFVWFQKTRWGFADVL